MPQVMSLVLLVAQLWSSGLGALVPDLAADPTAVRATVVGELLTVERHRPVADLDPGRGPQHGPVHRGAVDPGRSGAAGPDQHELVRLVVPDLRVHRVEPG